MALKLSPLPKSLYKYRSISGEAAGYTRDILVNHRLWFSTASTFTSEFRMLKEAPHAPRGYVYAAMMLVAGQVAAVPFVASIPSM